MNPTDKERPKRKRRSKATILSQRDQLRKKLNKALKRVESLEGQKHLLNCLLDDEQKSYQKLFERNSELLKALGKTLGKVQPRPWWKLW